MYPRLIRYQNLYPPHVTGLVLELVPGYIMVPGYTVFLLTELFVNMHCVGLRVSAFKR